MFVPAPFSATMMNKATSGAGDSYYALNYTYKTVVVTFTGSGATTTIIQISNDGERWATAKNADGTDASFTADGYFESDEAFAYIRGNNTVAGGKTVKMDLAMNK